MSAAFASIYQSANTYEQQFEDSLLSSHAVFKNLIAKLSAAMTVLPPSGAVAGVYAAVDANRGVWKAPANVSLAAVSGVTEFIDDKEQEELNIDVTAGKSINAIRPFTGKGVLVWGARTLAGNDNEWRYVPVRRFFNMVEESIKKSTAWAVFEPNDANTWIKVKSMIENYLIQKWRDGALVGAKADDAFFVKVGLGVTMTAQDILEGRMNVEIGMAVVRPAEFIILKFSHKMQKS
jgi:phage tail sheath protein FI